MQISKVRKTYLHTFFFPIEFSNKLFQKECQGFHVSRKVDFHKGKDVDLPAVPSYHYQIPLGRDRVASVVSLKEQIFVHFKHVCYLKAYML